MYLLTYKNCLAYQLVAKPLESRKFEASNFTLAQFVPSFLACIATYSIRIYYTSDYIKDGWVDVLPTKKHRYTSTKAGSLSSQLDPPSLIQNEQLPPTSVASKTDQFSTVVYCVVDLPQENILPTKIFQITVSS